MRDEQKPKWRTISVWVPQYHRLKLLAAHRGLTLVAVIEWLLTLGEAEQYGPGSSAGERLQAQQDGGSNPPRAS